MSTEKIARFIAESTYEQLPEEAIATAKGSILDYLGVALAGGGEPGSRLITEYIREEGGRPEAGVIGGGFKAVASHAAWANGTQGHALDYDDTSEAFMGHPTVALLPGVLALGEKLGLSGKDVLLSYITGFEAGASVAPVCILQSYLLGWHSTCTMGTIGAAAACARLLRLTIEETRMALGIGATLAGGLKQNFGTMTKPLHAGNAARNGVVAATLAQRGFTADGSILEAPQGFCKVFSGGAELDMARLGEGLGERYTIISGIAIKPYPSCHGTHSSIETTLELRKRHNIKAEDVEEVELRCNPFVETAAIHSRPQTGLEGKFSNQYCVAAALIDGEVGLKSFTDEMVMRPQAQELISKVKYSHPPEFQALGLGSETVIRLKGGREFSYRVNAPRGFADSPLGWEEICAKYRDCASMALPAAAVERSLELVSNLEAVTGIGQLMEIVAFKKA